MSRQSDLSAPPVRVAASAAGPLKTLLPAAGLLVASVLAGCGPVYVHERGYYGTGYYAPASPAPAPAASPAAATVADPYFGDLDGHGRWVNTPEYGTVWVPYAAATPTWRPYYHGRWEYTAYGWTWVSSESWAATYHYGRWAWVGGYNWVWIPGYTWAPAWVTWRHGGGCVGWAPMGPDYIVGSSVTIHYSYWIFVPETQVVGYPVQTVVIQPANVPKVYDQSVVIHSQAQIRGHDGRPVSYDRGPDPRTAEGWTRQPIREQPVDSIPSARPRPIPADAPARPSRPGRPETPATRPGTPESPEPRPSRPGTPESPEPRPTRPGTPESPESPEPRPTRPGTPEAPEPTRPETRPTRPGTPEAPEPTRPETRPTRPGTPEAPEPTRPETRPSRPETRPDTINNPHGPTTPREEQPTRPSPQPSRPEPQPTRPAPQPQPQPQPQPAPVNPSPRPTPLPQPSRPEPPRAKQPPPKQRAPAPPAPKATPRPATRPGTAR